MLDSIAAPQNADPGTLAGQKAPSPRSLAFERAYHAALRSPCTQTRSRVPSIPSPATPTCCSATTLYDDDTPTHSLKCGPAARTHASPGKQLLVQLWSIAAACVPPHDVLCAELQALAAVGPRAQRAGSARSGALASGASQHSVAHWASLLSCATKPVPVSAALAHGDQSVSPFNSTQRPSHQPNMWPGTPPSRFMTHPTTTSTTASGGGRRCEVGGGLLLSTWWLTRAAQVVGDGAARRWLSARLDAHSCGVVAAGGSELCDAAARVEGDPELRYAAARTVARALLAAAHER